LDGARPVLLADALEEAGCTDAEILRQRSITVSEPTGKRKKSRSDRIARLTVQ
jgi:hypothetical protein